MAITKTVTKQTLTLNVEDGVNSQGAAKTKGHNDAGVRPESEPAAIMQAAAALGTLISHELMGVVVTEKAELAQYKRAQVQNVYLLERSWNEWKKFYNWHLKKPMAAKKFSA